MKFQVYIKDPDVFYEAVKDTVAQDLKKSGLPKEEQDIPKRNKRR